MPTCLHVAKVAKTSRMVTNHIWPLAAFTIESTELHSINLNYKGINSNHLTGDKTMKNFKEGDIVNVLDGSWSFTIINGELKHRYGYELTKKEFKILGLDCRLPTDDNDLSGIPYNNVILINIDTQEIVFSQKRFLKLIYRCCPYCKATLKI